MVITCDRCKREIFKTELCNYCNRTICVLCTKSAQRVQKVTRLAICKDCWGNMSRRKMFKNKINGITNLAQRS
jgi:hypothetical protein